MWYRTITVTRDTLFPNSQDCEKYLGIDREQSVERGRALILPHIKVAFLLVSK